MQTRTRSASRDSGLGDSQQSSQDDSAPQEEWVPAKKLRKIAPARPSQWVCVLPGRWAWRTEQSNRSTFVSIKVM